MAGYPRLRITSEGTARGTRVCLEDDNGKQIDVSNIVQAIRWEIAGPNEIAVATVEFVRLRGFEAEAELVEATIRRLEEGSDAQR